MRLDKIGYGLNFQDLRQLVYRFVIQNKIRHNFNNDTQMAGQSWCREFMERNTCLSVRVAKGLSYSRARGLTYSAVSKFYDNLSELMTKYDLFSTPSHIFNCDETGLQLIYKPKKVISERGKRSVFCQTNGEKGETVSLLACCSATGEFMPPFVIMKGKRHNPNYEIGMPGGTKVILSESGYMKAELFTIFLDHFLLHKPAGHVILILDGHGSHCSDPDSLQKAIDNDVHLLCLPPHTTSKLQPLDVGVFGPLKTHFGESCRQHVRQYPGSGINKVVLGPILKEAWLRATTISNATNAFKSCGIYPFDRHYIRDEVLMPSTVHINIKLESEEKTIATNSNLSQLPDTPLSPLTTTKQ